MLTEIDDESRQAMINCFLVHYRCKTEPGIQTKRRRSKDLVKLKMAREHWKNMCVVLEEVVFSWCQIIDFVR